MTIRDTIAFYAAIICACVWGSEGNAFGFFCFAGWAALIYITGRSAEIDKESNK